MFSAAGRGEAQNPRPSESLEFEGGLLRDYRDATQDAFYYRLTYQGKKVRSAGKEFSAASNLNAPIAQTHDKAGDSRGFSLRLERGSVSTKSEIFELLGVKPLNFRWPGLARLRGTAQLNGQFDGDVINAAIGVETPPIHPLHALNEATPANITNWVVFGVQGERRERDSTGIVEENGVVTGRAFFGRGFGWKRSKQLTGPKKDLVRDVFEQAHTYQEALALRPVIKERIKQGKETDADRLIQYIAQEGEGLSAGDRLRPELWNLRVVEAATWNEGNTPADQPTLALWLEGLIWRQFGKDRHRELKSRGV